MNVKILTALSVLTAATVSTAAHAGTVVCADGTIYNLTSDAISYEVACADHGGIGPSQLPGANAIKASRASAVPVRSSESRRSEEERPSRPRN